VLAKGTETAKGIPFFEPNVIPCMKGSYDFHGGRIDVWFTREPVVFDASWKDARLSGYDVRRKTDGALKVVAYRGSERWTVFLALDRDEAALGAFLATFLDRFRYFLHYAKDDSEVSFPAVLKVGG
jgi:hypothetical protein